MISERPPVMLESWGPVVPEHLADILPESDESLKAWPLAIIRRPEIEKEKSELARAACDNVELDMFDAGGKDIAVTIDADILDGIYKEASIDFYEVMERRDKIEAAAIVLFGECELLGMHTSGSKIRECVRMMLDELFRLGELGD